MKAHDLPPADEAAADHSRRLRDLIHAAIQDGAGRISFARYMELALYAPGLGYYSAGRRQFGSAGDFTTAPELSPLFARCLARQCAQVLADIDGGDILEFGAGSGVMAADLLEALAAAACLPGRYFILEPSATLRTRQRALLQERLPALLERVQWLDALPPPGFRGVILANEVLDAMPVHRLVKRGDGLSELYVTIVDGGLAWREGGLSDPRLAAPLRQWLDTLPEGYVCEVNPAAAAWVRSLADFLEAGLVLIIDYGYPAAEYYHPQRVTGTLRCYYRHRAHDNPLRLPGLEDITAHVDFTALAEAAVSAGLRVAGYASQAAFLQGCGIAEMVDLAAEPDMRRQVEVARQLRQLLLPGEMGEAFKVLALSRGWGASPLGFSLRDERARL